MKTNEVIVAEDYGIEEQKKKELLSNLPQILEEREALIPQHAEILKMDIEDPETWAKARELRLKIRDNRTKGINTWHKTSKDYFLKGGQFVDAIKRKETAINERMEEQLAEIEKYEEIQRQKRLDELKARREKEIESWKDFAPDLQFELLEEGEFQKILSGAKLQHEKEEEMARKEQEEQEKRARIEKLVRERKDKVISVWNFFDHKLDLSTISDEDFEAALIEAELSKTEHEAKQKEIQRRNEELEKERKAMEAKIEAERKAAQKKLEAERKAREAMEAKIKAEQERKAKEEKERLELEKQKQLAPDKDKLRGFAKLIMDIETPKFKSKEAQVIGKSVEGLLLKVIDYIDKKINEL